MLANLRRIAALAAILATLTAVLLIAPVAWSQPEGGAEPAGLLHYQAGLEEYDEGRYEAALALFTRAAAAGHVRAQEIAGMMHWLGPVYYGEGIAHDRAAAQRWFAAAASRGSETGAMMLQRMAAAPAAVAGGGRP